MKHLLISNFNISILVFMSSLLFTLSSANAQKVSVCDDGKLLMVSPERVKAFTDRGYAVDLDGDGYFTKENDCGKAVDPDDNDRYVTGRNNDRDLDGRPNPNVHVDGANQMGGGRPGLVNVVNNPGNVRPDPEDGHVDGANQMGGVRPNPDLGNVANNNNIGNVRPDPEDGHVDGANQMGGVRPNPDLANVANNNNMGNVRPDPENHIDGANQMGDGRPNPDLANVANNNNLGNVRPDPEDGHVDGANQVGNGNNFSDGRPDRGDDIPTDKGDDGKSDPGQDGYNANNNPDGRPDPNVHVDGADGRMANPGTTTGTITQVVRPGINSTTTKLASDCGDNLAHGKKVTSDISDDNDLEYVVDCSTRKAWSSGKKASKSNPYCIEIDLESRYEVDQIRLTNNQSQKGESIYKIHFSTNGKRWSEVEKVKSQSDVIEVSTGGDKARYIRVETVKSAGEIDWYEIEVFGK